MRRSHGYAARGQAPTTLTAAEETKLLTASGHRREDFRDHVLFAFALGTGLREAEIVALNVGDVYDGERVRMRLALHTFKGQEKRKGRAPAPVQGAFMSKTVADKLRRFARWKKREGESLTLVAPLFCARPEGRAVAMWNKTGGRLSTRSVRHLCKVWSARAELDQPFRFHTLRHTAITKLYRATGGDLLKAQRFARHLDIVTTKIYAHVSDDELAADVRRL